MKIAIIGAGNMGGAIARGLAKGSLVQACDICVSNPSTGKLEALKADFPDINVTQDNQEAATGAEYIMLCVKPWLVKSVLKALRLNARQVIVSVAAGITFEELAHCLVEKETTLFRLVPNTAISELQSMTFIAGRNATPEQTQLMCDLFNEMGCAMLIPEEKIAAATSLASCGIAYALKYIQAATQGGIELGIPAKDGMRMVAQSLAGAAALILNNDTHPALEVEKVCTPGGYTIRGINRLEQDGFTSAVINALKASMY